MSLYQLQSRSSISGSIRLSIQIGFRTPLPWSSVVLNQFSNTPTLILCSPISLNQFLNTPNLGEEWIGVAKMA